MGIDVKNAQKKMVMGWDENGYRHIRHPKNYEIQQMNEAMYEGVNIGYFITLEFGKKFNDTDCCKMVYKWMNKVARATKQHIHYQGNGGIQPIGEKNHVHLIVSCQKTEVEPFTFQHLWMQVVRKTSSKGANGKSIRPVTNIDFLNNSHEHQPSRYAGENQDTLRNLYGCDVLSLDRERNAGYYTILHYFPVKGVGCPKTGACKYKVCRHKK